MTFRSRSTLLSTLPLAAGDTPGYPAGTRFVKPGEEGTSSIVNRAYAALAENTDDLDTRLDTLAAYTIASPEIGVLTAFTGAGIDIDPSGGAAGDINYTGSLYLGESGWTGQEKLDLLFQLLDEDYNEVLVDGVEVTVANLSGNALGDGFVSTLTTLNLSATLPSGNYRLCYGRGSELQALPAYALLGAGIRGLEEVPGEAARRSVYVLDASGTGPADFTGATALQDALAALKGGFGSVVLFLRAGTYTGPVGTWLMLDHPDVVITGEGDDATNGTIITISPGQQVAMSAADVRLEDLRIAVSGTQLGGEAVTVSGDDASLERVTLENLKLAILGNRFRGVDLVCGGYDQGLYAYGGYTGHVIENVTVNYSSTPSVNPLVVLESTSGGLMRNVVAGTTAAGAQDCLRISGTVLWQVENSIFKASSTFRSLVVAATMSSFSRAAFRSCSFASKSGTTFDGLYQLAGISFERCSFEGDQTLLDIGVDSSNSDVQFEHCRFISTAGVWYAARFVRIRSLGLNYSTSPFVSLRSCSFADNRCQGNDSPDAPGTVTPTVPTTYWPIVELSGVKGENLTLVRTGITYLVAHSPWARLTNCDITGLRVVTGTSMDALYEYTGGSYMDGVVEVLGNSYVRDLQIGKRFPGNWFFGLLYLAGYAFDSTAGVYRKKAVVDGFAVDASDADNADPDYDIGWGNGGDYRIGMLATLGGNAVLERLTYDANGLMGTGLAHGQSCFVALNGNRNVLCDFDLYHTSANCELMYGVRDNGVHSVISSGRIFSINDLAVNIEMQVLVYLGGVHSQILDNTFIRTEHHPDAGHRFIRSPTADERFHKIVGNLFWNIGGLAVGETEFIEVHATAAPTCVVTGNQLYASHVSETTDPVIDAIGAVGLADNYADSGPLTDITI